MGKTKPVELQISENLIEVDIISNFFDITKQCRESFYFLRSLRNIISSQLILEEDKDNESKLVDYKKKANDLIAYFKEIDEPYCASEVVEDQLTRLSEGELELNYIIDSIKKYIELKSKMDKLQIEILNHVMNIESKIIKKLIEGKSYVSEFEGILQLNRLYLMAFEHSAEEDCIMSYSICTKSRKIQRDLGIHGIKLPEIIKIRDYSFELEKTRKIFKLTHKNFFKIILNLPRLEEEKSLKEISKKQYSLNKHMTIITYIIFILTFFSIITGSISVYYTIKDHNEIQQQQNIIQKEENNESNLNDGA